ncbi:MAG: alkaline phosphatase family protein [Sedimentisphaerales bacterium]|nr:alkaline phosphatase family protein [Sedimentisphaerales bacterium]
MLKRAILILVILSLTQLLPASFGAADHPRNIILFGWDGAQREHVKACLDRRELPNLQKLIEEGTFVEIDIEGKTDTKAGWSQILSGYYPEVTGVYSNKQYQPIPEGLSIFERLEAHFGPDKFITVAVIADSGNFGAGGPKKTILTDEKNQSSQGNETKAGKKNAAGEQAKTGNYSELQGYILVDKDTRYHVIPGQPFHITRNNMDLFENSLKENKKVGTRAIELIEKYKDKPFFFFVDFAEVDKAGHEHGENSKEYNDALISNDLWTGRIMAKVRELGLADNTELYVTADHGLNEGEKESSFAPYVFLATNNKKVNRNGRRQDVAPTIMEAFGLNLSELKPVLDGISLTKPDNRPPAKITPDARKPDAIYVDTPQEVVDKMLEMAKVTKDDLLYDLGCGDGRFVVTAARKYGCKAVGYDISPRRVRESLENVKKNNVEHLVRIEQKDIFTLDISQADVITIFLLPNMIEKLIPEFDKLKSGSRIVSYKFGMKGVMPDKTVNFISPIDKSQHILYLWTTPLNKVWMWKNGKPPARTNPR